MKKNVWLLLAGLLLAWSLLPAGALAADNQNFVESAYQEQDNGLEMICVLPGEEGGADQFRVTLGSQELPIRSVSTLEQEGLPKTVYCLVDVSGSMKGRMEQVQEALHAISGGLSDKDSMIIGKMGNQITDSAVLSSKEEMDAQIDALQYTGEDTDLYSGIIHGLNYLQQDAGIHHVKALIVFSDGCDIQDDGSTYNEAYAACGKADIPVYTVAPILSGDDYEKAKELGSFARNSTGGMHFPASDDGGSVPVAMTGAEMGNAIVAALGKTLHVSADLSGIQDTGADTYLLSVSFQSAGGKSYEDSLELKAGELKLPAEEKPTPEPEKKDFRPLAIAVIAAAVVIAAILAVILIRRKKRREAERLEAERLEEERLEAERQKEERLAREREEKEQKERELALQREQEERRKQEAFAAIPRLMVRLTAIGTRNKEHVIELVKDYEITVGRNGKSKAILDAQDTKLSGIHFVMLWDGKSVYLWDAKSKNGTSVNGVVIGHLGKVSVQPDDRVRAGSYEYRMHWEEES